VFGLASVRRTHGFVAGLDVPLWPSFVASATVVIVVTVGLASSAADSTIYREMLTSIVSRIRSMPFRITHLDGVLDRIQTHLADRVRRSGDWGLAAAPLPAAGTNGETVASVDQFFAPTVPAVRLLLVFVDYIFDYTFDSDSVDAVNLISVVGSAQKSLSQRHRTYHCNKMTVKKHCLC